MKKSTKAFIFIVVAGFIGLYLGFLLDAAGAVGIILSIATLGAFIVDSNEDSHTK